MDRVAHELGLDRAEVRRRNFIRPEQMPFNCRVIGRDGSPVLYDSGDYAGTQALALQGGDWAGFPARQAAARAEGRYLGIGLANFVEGTGLGPYEGATVRISTNGSITVYTGAAPQGQSHHTTLAQIVADQLGVEPGAVQIVTGDTQGISLAGRRYLCRAQRGQCRECCSPGCRRTAAQDPGTGGEGAQGGAWEGRCSRRYGVGRRRASEQHQPRPVGGGRRRYARLLTGRRHDARFGAHQLFRAGSVDLLQWLPRCRSRSGPGDRGREAVALRRGGRLWSADQPDGGSWAGGGRGCARHWQRVTRRIGLRRVGAAAFSPSGGMVPAFYVSSPFSRISVCV